MIEVYRLDDKVSTAEAEAIAHRYLRGYARGKRDALAGQELSLSETPEGEGFGHGYADGHQNGRIR